MKQTIVTFIMVLLIAGFSLRVNAEADSVTPPTVSSEAAVVMDELTGTILYEKNANAKMYPASLTKIATAIYAIEKGNLDDVVTVSEKARDVEGTRVYLEEGEQVTLKKLIQGLLINSGNDAAIAIAEYMSGSVENFASDLNKYMEKEIGVTNTNFENPHGLFDPNHVTTAKDLATITRYARKNQVFREIFGTKELKWNGESWDTTLYAHNKLMREYAYEGVTGGKTGYVDQSGFTLATTAKRENLSVIVITLNSNIQSVAYNDSRNLLDYSFANYQTSTIPKGTTFDIDDQKYKTEKDLSFTTSINEQWSENVKKDGTLDIVNQDGETITSFSLKKLEMPNDNARSADVQGKATQNVTTASPLEEHFSLIALIVFSIVFIIFLTCYREMRNI
ncbi:D-alanyl-D-alanine carboxypeptidase [Aquibacillus sp. 3ASR75-11]|uniref:D-alanyl-D-alanine carboxypeptidase n=1 Tax=Terrihalobacillus insolitus TaxID=2950438 RepID=A0A9X3WTF7_9BACI|nr:D-alanyl-D-alanine carboxypeptidase family protein [Terrihalobacillus insolitus]MDC3414802.1 D-alanyl-D-alanine carboxypeptidase [Terrihalobacillus insolitus]MDC3425637.1 D-alanyl-D-alanine carboxypeptidase [Terrihalobacillus insolitus]